VRSRYLETAVEELFISQSLPGNKYGCHNMLYVWCFSRVLRRDFNSRRTAVKMAVSVSGSAPLRLPKFMAGCGWFSIREVECSRAFVTYSTVPENSLLAITTHGSVKEKDLPCVTGRGGL
jgi:hypothetical protein